MADRLLGPSAVATPARAPAGFGGGLVPPVAGAAGAAAAAVGAAELVNVRLVLLALAALPLIAAAPPTPKLPRAPAGAAQGRFVLPDRPVWAGEVFDLGLDWQVDWSLFRNLDGDLAWKPDPLVADAWSTPVLDHPAP